MRETSRKVAQSKIKIDTVFDNSEYISTEKIAGKKDKTEDVDKSKIQKPKQPKKERSLTKQSDKVRNS